MRSRNEQKGRTLADHELKGALGGTNSLPPTPGNDGSSPQTDARAVVIEDGYS